MEGQGSKLLTSDRLILRQFVIEDSNAMFRNWTSSKVVTDHLLWDCHESEDKTRELISSWLGSYNRGRYYNWAICDRDNQPIGNINASFYGGIRNTVEISYCLGQNWWGQGIMTEALKRLLEYFFEEEGITRIQGLHNLGNDRSGRVMIKAGLLYEGTLRAFTNINGKVYDVKIYGLSYEDWKSQRRNYVNKTGKTYRSF